MSFDHEEKQTDNTNDSEEDYQAFLEWYEENETWLEGCHTERQAFYAAWEAGQKWLLKQKQT